MFRNNLRRVARMLSLKRLIRTNPPISVSDDTLEALTESLKKAYEWTPRRVTKHHEQPEYHSKKQDVLNGRLSQLRL